ncbi:MAG: prepilin-type N-terminal cleavage/methylation domain-containing protein [Hydrogenothermaceae bacterium]|nr:prepilin-type N-terminal cleavage/methylation domain-containing protein [Hydrogenothermaceae bacterium]
MKGSGAFSLVEFLIVISIIAIIISLSINAYYKYQISSVKSAVISDLRNCIGDISIQRQKGDELQLAEIVNNCPKSKFTKNIVLERDDPIVLKAEVDSNYGVIECEYNEQNGSVKCSSPF